MTITSEKKEKLNHKYLLGAKNSNESLKTSFEPQMIGKLNPWKGEGSKDKSNERKKVKESINFRMCLAITFPLRRMNE